jgi:hypothetical protein
MDVHVPRPIVVGLRLRGIDVVTAQEDGADTFRDPELLDRATHLQRPLFTRDEDFLREAVQRLRASANFATVIYAHQLRVPIRQCVEDLEVFAKVAAPHEARGRILFLPL